MKSMVLCAVALRAFEARAKPVGHIIVRWNTDRSAMPALARETDGHVVEVADQATFHSAVERLPRLVDRLFARTRHGLHWPYSSIPFSSTCAIRAPGSTRLPYVGGEYRASIRRPRTIHKPWCDRRPRARQPR